MLFLLLSGVSTVQVQLVYLAHLHPFALERLVELKFYCVSNAVQSHQYILESNSSPCFPSKGALLEAMANGDKQCLMPTCRRCCDCIKRVGY